jgi:hypothetical protein
VTATTVVDQETDERLRPLGVYRIQNPLTLARRLEQARPFELR